MKPKDLCLIPQRVAIAAQQDGWWIRSMIVWHKPNPMPQSVTDRPTNAYEHIIMITKSQRYFWDMDAVMEKASVNPLGRNLRNVWTFATQPMSWPEGVEHFATFPEELPRRCILAASRPAGKRCDCDEIISTPTGSGPIDDPSLITGRGGFNRPRRADEGVRPITRREQRSYALQLSSSRHKTRNGTTLWTCL